ncbi:ribosomal protein L30p/L7e-domain-containing protein [Xylaria venustula]|nr:ribosomal protein L30p/L7e-domain-containing protein [Xylaria venustula]
MSFFRITLHRSAIGLPQRTRGVLAALGLRKRNQTVFHPVTPDAAGMIMKVKELVLVKEVEEALTTKQLREERKPEPGFWLETAVPRDTDAGWGTEEGKDLVMTGFLDQRMLGVVNWITGSSQPTE